jgi:hypothetical protein
LCHDKASAKGETRVFYRDIKPYDAPERLDQLRGPRRGRLDLPLNVYWGPKPIVDLDTVGGAVKAYQAVLNEGRVVDQIELLNRDLLIEIWPKLMLPDRVRVHWENRFPELIAAA